MKSFLILIGLASNFVLANFSITVCPTLQLSGNVVTKFENLIVAASTKRNIIGHKVDVICNEGSQITSSLKLDNISYAIVGEQECLRVLKSVYKNSRGVYNFALNFELKDSANNIQVLSFSATNEHCTYEGNLSGRSKTIVKVR